MVSVVLNMCERGRWTRERMSQSFELREQPQGKRRIELMRMSIWLAFHSVVVISCNGQNEYKTSLDTEKFKDSEPSMYEKGLN